MVKVFNKVSMLVLTLFTATLFIFISACSFFAPEVTLSQKDVTIYVGDTFRLTAKAAGTVKWTSADEEVATVSDNGTVTGVSEGETTVSAAYNGAVASCTVTVVDETAENPGGDTGENPGGDTGENPGGDTGENPGGDTGENPGGDTGENPGGDTGENPGGDTGENPGEDATQPWGDRQLVWSDEFDGTTLDMTKWNYQTGIQDQYGSSTGPSYWGNSELQYYTQDAVTVSDGTMKITATKQLMGDRPYTSARIVTRDKYSFTYGYIEARIKMPSVEGLWPAFWMLPQPSTSANTNNEYGGWPNSGEIDIMEAKGRLPGQTDHTLHFSNEGSEWASTYMSKSQQFSGSTISDWHTYGLEWTADEITWYVDGVAVYSLTSDIWWSKGDRDNPSAPFDTDFYILFNLAVGGQYDGFREPPADFTSAAMEVDYVRVYQ